MIRWNKRVAQDQRAREERIGRTWAKFRQAMWDHFHERVPQFTSPESRALVMRHAFHSRPIPGWEWDSVLAAEDVGCGDSVESSEAAMPTIATPGTKHKVEVLAARAAAGETLWHPDDAAAYGPLD